MDGYDVVSCGDDVVVCEVVAEGDTGDVGSLQHLESFGEVDILEEWQFGIAYSGYACCAFNCCTESPSRVEGCVEIEHWLVGDG